MISFVCRARNEERTLGQALRSLQSLEVPHEILVVLHRCTDDSEKIVLECQREQPSIRLFQCDVPISRAGLETLITPEGSKHSLASFYNWCFCLYGGAPHSWQFKLDADFLLSPALIQFLNSEEFRSIQVPTRIRFPAVCGEIRNAEEYLFNCLERYKKHIFWEVPVFGSESTSIFQPDCEISHVSKLTETKPYWREPPWFESEQTEEARELKRRYDLAVSLLGPEPIGMARASNPECDAYFHRACLFQEQLALQGISFFE